MFAIFWKLLTALAIFGAAQIGYKWVPMIWDQDPISSVLIGGALFTMAANWFIELLEPIDAGN